MKFWKVLAVLALVVAACGDSGDTTTTTVAATTPPVTSPPTTLPAETTTTLPAETTTTIPETTTTVSTLPPSDVFVTTGGLGAVRVGQTVEEAEAASGLDLVGELDPTVSDECYFVTVADDPVYSGVAFMVYQDTVGRVDVTPPSNVTTRSGAGIGTTEQQLRELFPGQIEDAGEFIIDGTGVMFVPRDEADAQFRVIFVLLDGAVATYRAGILPAVGFGEGCA